MALNPLKAAVKEAILRPNARIRVFFRHEATNVKNQLCSLELPGHRTHRRRNVIARVQNIDAFASHYSQYLSCSNCDIVKRSRQRRRFVVCKAMPRDSLGLKRSLLVRYFLRRPAFMESRFEGEKADPNPLRLQLTQIREHLRLHQWLSKPKITD